LIISGACRPRSTSVDSGDSRPAPSPSESSEAGLASHRSRGRKSGSSRVRLPSVGKGVGQSDGRWISPPAENAAPRPSTADGERPARRRRRRPRQRWTRPSASMRRGLLTFRPKPRPSRSDLGLRRIDGKRKGAVASGTPARARLGHAKRG
jgi:hypothetical protein